MQFPRHAWGVGDLCLQEHLLLHCLPGALSQGLSRGRGVAPGRASRLTSQPGLPHPSQQSRDDKRGPHLPAVQRRLWPGLWALQLVLKRRRGKE